MNKKYCVILSIFALGFGFTHGASEELDAPPTKRARRAATIPQAVINQAFIHLNKKDNESGLRAILRRYPDIVNVVDLLKRTLLQQAALAGYVNMAKILIEGGADVNAVDCYGRASLHEAQIADVVQALIKAGANITAVDCYGRTPLSAWLSIVATQI